MKIVSPKLKSKGLNLIHESKYKLDILDFNNAKNN